MMRRLLPLLLSLCACAAFARAPAINLTPLTPQEIPALLKPPAQGERILMFWGLDCVYCEPNMQALAKLQRAHPKQIEFITVDTDDIQTNRAAIVKRLAAVPGMQDFAARAYTEASPERMNFLVDPGWGGVLPHTIVVFANGKRIAMNGLLTPKQLRSIGPR